MEAAQVLLSLGYFHKVVDGFSAFVCDRLVLAFSLVFF
jgi:hypothetical protein